MLMLASCAAEPTPGSPEKPTQPAKPSNIKPVAAEFSDLKVFTTKSPSPIPTSTTPPPTSPATPTAIIAATATPEDSTHPNTIVALATLVPTDEHWIDFNLTDGFTRLMAGHTILQELPSAYGSGIAGSATDFYSTAPGQYRVYSKTESLYHDEVYSNLYFKGWVGFDPDRANGFHSFLMDEKGNVVDNHLGPISHGCIRIENWQAVYEFAQIGMPVIVHGNAKSEGTSKKAE